jgi:hypothetical protein
MSDSRSFQFKVHISVIWRQNFFILLHRTWSVQYILF